MKSTIPKLPKLGSFFVEILQGTLLNELDFLGVWFIAKIRELALE